MKGSDGNGNHKSIKKMTVANKNYGNTKATQQQCADLGLIDH